MKQRIHTFRTDPAQLDFSALWQAPRPAGRPSYRKDADGYRGVRVAEDGTIGRLAERMASDDRAAIPELAS